MNLRRRFRILRRDAGDALLRLAGPWALERLARTWEVEFRGLEHRREAEAGPGYLLSMWHGRMLVGLSPHRMRDYCVLVSPSDDGTLVTRLLDRNGYRVIRGSSNQRTERALREMVTTLRERGGALVITPDGPRGPRHSMNDGLAWLAKVTGFPVVPCGFVCDRAWHLSSWDRFTIPKRGARLRLGYGPLVRVAADATEAEVRAASEEIRRRMIAAEEAGFAELGVEADG